MNFWKPKAKICLNLIHNIITGPVRLPGGLELYKNKNAANMINLIEHFKIHLPIAKNGIFWNGKPDEFSNIYYNLNYSQQFGLTPYAKIWDKEKKNWTYGTFDGKPRPHNGHDFASNDIVFLAMPCRSWLSYVGFDPGGYGNCVFIETETIIENGETFKMEFVIGHMKELSVLEPYHWYEAGTIIGQMSNTGMSSGQHTHMGGRPWIENKDGWQYLYPDDGARGYIDLTELFIEKPIYNKQKLITQANFMAINDKKLIFNNDTGEIGWLYGGKLRIATPERFAKMLGSYLVRKEGVNINGTEFDKLEKVNF